MATLYHHSSNRGGGGAGTHNKYNRSNIMTLVETVSMQDEQAGVVVSPLLLSPRGTRVCSGIVAPAFLLCLAEQA